MIIFVDFFEKTIIIISRMDILRNYPLAANALASVIAGQKVIAGAKQLRKALASGTAACVFLAADADPAITEPIAQACRHYDVQTVWVRSKADLGRACGIDVGAAVAATVKSL